MIQLRDYQTRLLDDIREAMARGTRRVLAVAPCGAGKTVMFAWLTQQVASRGKRVVIVAHRVEITDQISAALTAMGVEHGRIAQGAARNGLPVQVAMVQTLARRLPSVPPPDLLVVDEAHHAVAGTWRTVAAAWPDARVLGVTATPERLDGRGLADAFDTLVHGPTVADLIAAGHLAPYRHYSAPEALEVSGIATLGGDYNAGQVAAAMVKQRIVGCAVTEYLKRADGKPAVAFCPTVAFAEAVAADFCAAGIPAAAVDGGMTPAARAQALGGLRDGSIKLITSCDLISEGFDVPAIGAAILLRPTKSLGLYLQQVGRALRPKADGSPAIIIDHVGNGLAHGLVDAERLWSLEGKPVRGETEAVRQCRTCYRVFPARGDAKCDRAPCGLAREAGAGAERAGPEAIDGELVDITQVDGDDYDKVAAIFEKMNTYHSGESRTIARFDPPVLAAIDPHNRGRQYVAALLQNWAGKTFGAWTLSAMPPVGKWGATTYRMDMARPPQAPLWAGGLCLRTSSLRDLLKRAETREHLAEIAKARGYKSGWVYHVMRDRAARQQAAG